MNTALRYILLATALLIGLWAPSFADTASPSASQRLPPDPPPLLMSTRRTKTEKQRSCKPPRMAICNASRS